MIIDDELFARDDLRYMLSEHPEIEVKWEVGRIDEALRLLEAGLGTGLGTVLFL